MKNFALIALATLLFPACQLDCIQATGPVEERTLELASFTAMEVSGTAHVTVEKGPQQRVVVTGQPEVIDLLETGVSRGVWAIRTRQCWSSVEGLSIHITTPAELTSVEVTGSAEVDAGRVFGLERTTLSTTGSGSIRVAEINAKELKLKITGSGSITARGTCALLAGSLSGSGDLHAADLAANAVDLQVSGSGSATVMAITSLDAEVSGSGEVRYSGKPQVKASISGSGSVLPLP
ncbi:MAG: DUF2807 domain-containing protein [Flavobacteriales bacterium]|nr:DUF2807 domain-containing protein [Flavobacteriales bacterium]MBP9080926.1 DUF2807 domain-containing protein [Flavobacteriales bacterium]